MTESYDDVGTAADHGSAGGPLRTRWEWLANRPSPPVPAGPVGKVSNRMLVYARPDQVPAFLPLIDQRRGGLMLAGVKASKRMRLLEDADFGGPVLADPAAYENDAATAEAPFILPEGQLLPPSLEDVLDWQLAAGATAAMTPTGYIRAGDTEALKAAARMVRKLNRRDVIFVAPLDISLVGRRFISQTIAILADTGCPVGLALGKQFDPLTQSKTIIPNLRDLVIQVPTFSMRTDFNAFDLVAHGGFAGAIGTGGTIRHVVEPPGKGYSGNPSDQSPSVLFPHLTCWWRGSRIAKLYGARPAPRCYCPACEGQRLSRFLRREHQHEAIKHAVAVWMPMAVDMLDAATMRDRAEYWRNVCAGSVREYAIITTQLQLVSGLKPQEPLEQWATLPAWPVGEPATA